MNQRWEFVASDFFFSSGESKNTQLFQYGEETMHAWEEGRLSDDIVAEQRKVEAAELIIFQVRGQRQEAVVQSRDLALTELDCVCVCVSLLPQFPLYWFSVPAIMKGWFDRVLTQGFAFSLVQMYNNGIFKVSVTSWCTYKGSFQRAI